MRLGSRKRLQGNRRNRQMSLNASRRAGFAGGKSGLEPLRLEHFHAHARELAFHGLFYGLRNFCCKTAQF